MFPKSPSGTQCVAKNRSRQQEKSIAIRLGGKTTKASGSKSEKGDVRLRKILRLEAKTTTKKSFSITQEMLDKIEDTAISSGEMPVIEIEFIDDTGKPLRSVCVVPTYVLDMIKYAGES
jgi:hypothetical protein